MYLEFFGLQEKPFGLTPDPKFLFLSEQHQEALDHLLYGVRQKEGFVVISGDIGTGKTTLCRALLERLDANEVTTALIFNPLLTEEELLRAILDDYNLPTRGTTRKELLDELNRFLLEELAGGKTVVLIIDEAQNLSTSCLELVRSLTNLETNKEKLIQIILVGSEELAAKLELPAMRHLQQRISVRYHLLPLNQNETRAYIQHRLSMAGAAGGISFDARAAKEIYLYSKGVPRRVNMIADRSLLAAYLEEGRRVARLHVVQGRRSLKGESAGGKQRYDFWLRREFHPGFLALFLVALAVAVLVMTPGAKQALQRQYLQRLGLTPVAAEQPRRDFTRVAIVPLASDSQRVENQAAETVTSVADNKKVADGMGTAEAMAKEDLTGSSEQAQSGGDRQIIAEKEKGESVSVLSLDSRETASPPEVGDLPQYLFKPPYIYTVQLYVMKLKENAMSKRQHLQERGFDAWAAWIDGGERGVCHLVAVGKYKNKEQALAKTRELKQQEEFQEARQIAVYAGIFSEPAGVLQ
jgi:general secretion pathway protein A